MKHIQIRYTLIYTLYTYIETFLLTYGFLLIASITAFVVQWQSTRVTPLIDYSYQVENAFRIYQGDVPYRDFFLVVAPGTYELMALLMHITHGYNHMVQVYFVMIVAFLTVVLTHKVLLFMGVSRKVSVCILIPLIFSGQSIYPYPLYDANVMISILFSLCIILFLRNNPKRSQKWYVLAGAASAIPIFFKQNTGGIFFISMIGAFLGSLILGRKKKDIHACIAFIFGGIIIIGSIFLWLIYSSSFDQYIYQTLLFPRFARNPVDAVFIILGQYASYVDMYLHDRFILVMTISFCFEIIVMAWVKKYVKKINMLPFLFWLFTCIYGIIFFLYVWNTKTPIVLYDSIVLWLWITTVFGSIICTIVSIVQKKKKEIFHVFLPIVYILTVHATFLSHGIIHSSAHMWPFFLCMIGYIYVTVSAYIPQSIWKGVVCGIFIMLTAILAQAVIQNYSMGFVRTDGEIDHARMKTLQGLSTPGPWIQDFEAMVQYVDHQIPHSDTVAFLPGEDPFFATSGRKNPLQFSLLHAGVYTLQPTIIVTEIVQKKILWIIVKREHQTYPCLWISNWEGISYWLNKRYQIVVTIGIYDIYKKI